MTNALTVWQERWQLSDDCMKELSQVLAPSLSIAPTGVSEATVQAQLRLTASYEDGHLWRNNNGKWVDKYGNHIRYGLGNDSKRINERFKSSDLIGITPITVTERHLGKMLGIFTAVEAKKPGFTHPMNKREQAQAAFLNVVQAIGGIGIFASDNAHYIAAVEEARHG